MYNNIKEAKTIDNNYDIAESVDCLLMTDAFITWNGYKPNFTTNPKCRLISPSNSELGKVSKFLIEVVSIIIRDKSILNQWIDANRVMNWFKNIDNKSNCIFVPFGMKEFYSSIS